MKKLKALKIFCLLLTAILLPSCAGNIPTLALGGLYEAQTIVALNVPTYSELSIEDVKFNNYAKLSEKDDYGRCLYMYIGKGITVGTNTTESYMVISQKCENGKVFYYPDICYIANLTDSCDFSLEEIAELKENNDWGKPLDDAKMASADIGIDAGLDFNYKDLKSIISDSGVLPENNGFFYDVFAKNADGSYLALVVAESVSDDSQGEQFKYYLINLDLVLQSATLIQEIDDPMSAQNIIVSVKESINKN